MKAMRKVLKQIPQLKYEFIDSSCCGGAGSIYLEAEHAEMADAIAEASLLPRLQQSPTPLWLPMVLPAVVKLWITVNTPPFIWLYLSMN